MTAKQVLFHSTARERVLHGAAQLADAVRLTLGPKSKSVLIQKKWGAPLVCNDGVTIAKEMELDDPVENLGAQMLRQAAEQTGDAVGDGTSTATVLAHAIVADGVRNVTAGASAVDLKRGLDRGLMVALAALKQLSRPVSSRLEKAQIATISAHNDTAIGELVANALEKVGGDGVISVEEAKTTETTLEVVEGLQFDRGYISPYFVTDQAAMEAVLEVALLRCTPTLEKLESECAGDERTGVQILRRALEEPTRQIAANSAVDGGVVVDRMLRAAGSQGFDAARKEYVDLFEAGIIDPAKVVRIALENAVSVASVLLLTEATLTEKPEKKPAHADAGVAPDM
jgi:chaperonin GroEL (HSP60 family)